MGESVAALVLAGGREAAASTNDWFPQLDWPIANVPVIEHLRAWLAGVAVRRLTICTNDAEHLLRLVRHSAARPALGCYEDRVPRGPAGAARDAALLSNSSEYLVLDASVLPDLDLADLLRVHRRSRAAATVVARPRSGEAEPGAAGAPAGVYVFSRAALLRVPPLGYRDIKEMLIPELHLRGEPVMTYVTTRPWPPRLDGLSSYIAAQQWMLNRMRRGEVSSDGYVWRGAACVHRDARVSRNARTAGPVMIGERARVADEVLLLGPAVVGARCEIGRGAVIGRSVLWEGCRVRARARLEGCVLPHNVLVQEGSVEMGGVCGSQVGPS